MSVFVFIAVHTGTANIWQSLCLQLVSCRTNCSVGSVSSAVMGRCTARSGPPRVPPSLAVRSLLIALNKGCLWLPVREPSLSTTVYFEQGQREGIARQTWLYFLLLTPPLPLSQHVINADWERNRERQCTPVFMFLQIGFLWPASPQSKCEMHHLTSLPSPWFLFLSLLAIERNSTLFFEIYQ